MRRTAMIVVASFALLAASAGAADAYWTSGSGRGSARVAAFDLEGRAPLVRTDGHGVWISWQQRPLGGRWLGRHRAGGYRVRRYGQDGRPRRMRSGCAERVAGGAVALRCFERDVPAGTWSYAVTPLLGGFTGREGPRREITVGDREPSPARERTIRRHGLDEISRPAARS